VKRLAPLLATVAAVGAATGVIYLLRPIAPDVSLGVIYVLAVMVVAIGFGMVYAIAAAVVSMLTFNFLFLPPLYSLTLQQSENWIVLAVYLGTAVVVSELATRTRRQSQESTLLAEIATSLLRRGEVSAELDRIAEETAKALDVDQARIELDGERSTTEPKGERFPLTVEGRRVGTIYLDGGGSRTAAARRRVLPALASLLGVAIDRERLAREALEAEALRRSDAMKTAVLRAVSHDLRSPLMAILTSASALARDDLELGRDDRTELAATILSEAERLDRLVSNLLDLSRLQAGAAQPEPRVLPIEDLVVEALDELGEAARQIDVSFPAESPAVRADEQQVQRILVNLLENALKYSPESERVRLQVATTPSEVLVRIIDRGPGVAERDLERIFEPFQRGSNAVRGAGLGLAIARGFAEANDGRVWAESLRGQGATFVLALPFVPVEVAVEA
jgi:two-component system, OmpR family, sensor histidine kinase KdpD